MSATLKIEVGKKYACIGRDESFGYATYCESLDCMQFHTWQKHFKHSAHPERGQYITVSPVWIGRPKEVIAGYTITREWTAEDEQAFQQDGRTRRDMLSAGRDGYQTSLF